MVCLSPVALAKHHIVPQATNIPYQPLLIKPHIQRTHSRRKTVFFKTSLAVSLLSLQSARSDQFFRLMDSSFHFWWIFFSWSIFGKNIFFLFTHILPYYIFSVQIFLIPISIVEKDCGTFLQFCPLPAPTKSIGWLLTLPILPPHTFLSPHL